MLNNTNCSFSTYTLSYLNKEPLDEEESKKEKIVDATETNLISLRRTIYLTIQSALDFEEAVHKLLKLNIKPGQEMEMCHMLIDCCAQQRSVEPFLYHVWPVKQ